MTLLTRRRLLVLATGGALFGGYRFGHTRLARPSTTTAPYSAAAQALLDRAWSGLDARRVLDTHVHLVGLGRGDTGCTVSERMQSLSNPIEHFKLGIYLEAAGVTDEAHADAQYLERLTSLIAGQRPHGRLLLMAFDHAYDDAGNVLLDESEFYTPNEYVLRVAREHPDLFVACASVHPARADAVQVLEQAIEGGAVAVKWLPNAMNIDPSSPRCDAFYDAMTRLRVPLITHAGEEKAVNAEERQRLGNPLHLRRPLSRGVTVIVAHCASLGQNPDLDAPTKPRVDNFDLFWRLMHEGEWNGRLFGDISAVTLFNRVGRPLEVLLDHPELHGRLVNGSDYPLPAINVLMQTRAIVEKGFLTEAERGALNEIDQHDPLLFDFALKRTVSRNGRRFADLVFMPGAEVFPRLA